MQTNTYEAPKAQQGSADGRGEVLENKCALLTESAEAGEFELWREPKVGEYTGLGRTRRWQLEKKGAFPARVQISDRAVGWYAREIIAFARSRPRVNSATP
jgi:prophage regulatory protein